MKSLFKIIKYMIPYKMLAFLSIFANIIHVIFHLLSILAFIPFLQILFGDSERVYEKPSFELTSDFVEQTFSYYMTPYIELHGELGALYFICVTVAVLFFFKNLF